jgi:hypothetical protein
MIDAQQIFAALAHGALRGEQFFRRGLVTHERVTSDVAEPVNCARLFATASDKPATFSRTRLARVREHFVYMLARESNHAAN